MDDELNDAVLRSEWNALSVAAREIILDAVAQANENGEVRLWSAHYHSGVAFSKAMKPYLTFDYARHSYVVSDAARELAAFALEHHLIPDWVYLRYDRNGAMSLLQTRDHVLVESLLKQGWYLISEAQFRGVSEMLARPCRKAMG